MPLEERVPAQERVVVRVLQAHLRRELGDRRLVGQAGGAEIGQDVEIRHRVLVRPEERIADRRLPVRGPPPHVARVHAEELAEGLVLEAPDLRHQWFDGRVVVLHGAHVHVVVPGEPNARLEREPTVLVARGYDRIAKPLGRSRQLRARRQTDRLLDLRRRLAWQAEHAEGETVVEARELLNLRIARASVAKRSERAPVVLLAITQESDVVAEAVQIAIRPERLFQERLGLVVLLLREVDQGQLVADRRILGRLRAGPARDTVPPGRDASAPRRPRR